jgi:crossover junction endodeoxyribonuclease RuvC
LQNPPRQECLCYKKLRAHRLHVPQHILPKKLWPGAARRRTLSAVPQSSKSSQANGEFFRVLGVDPAAAGATGYGVIESDGRRCRMLRFGALRATRKGPEHFPERLREIHTVLGDLIDEFEPHEVAVESVFTALNMKTALKLAEVRGVVLLAAAQRDIPVCSYSPREVKACVAGYGHADKQQMQLMVRALLCMTETPEPADAADALGVALCHMQAAQFRARLGAGSNAGRHDFASSPRGARSQNAVSRIQEVRTESRTETRTGSRIPVLR